MKVLKFTITALALTSFVGSAYAQDDSGAYGSLGVATYEFDTYGADVKVGYNFNQYFGVEAQGILGLTSKTDTFAGNTFKSKMDYTVAGFGVLRLPVNEQFDLFARGGYHHTGVTLDGTFNGVTTTASGDVDGFAVGGGVQYNFSDVSGIRAEYTYYDQGALGLDTVSISYVRKF